MTRKDDLEQSIRESYSIIREYESTIRISDRPEEKIRAQRAIDGQWAFIKGYLGDYRALTGNALPNDIAQIARHFRTGWEVPEDAAAKRKTESASPPARPQPGQPRRWKCVAGIGASIVVVTLLVWGMSGVSGPNGPRTATPAVPTMVVVVPITDTPTMPTSTNTPLPTFTSTPKPVLTDTPKSPTPTATNTATPTPTSTPEPTPTFTVAPRPPTETPTATPVPEAIVAAESVNLRTGPGTNYDVVGVANNADVFTLLARTSNNAWLLVKRDGAEVWIYAILVSTTPEVTLVPTASSTPPPPPPTPTPTSTPTATYTPAPTATNTVPPPPPPTQTPYPTPPPPT